MENIIDILSEYEKDIAENPYYQFVYDEDEVKWFYNHCVPELKRDEVYYFSLSARNKCLTQEEKSFYSLGRSEMFSKSLIRHNGWEKFMEAIYRCETSKKGFVTRTNKSFPQKCLILYWNINPSNVRKVIADQMVNLIELQDEIINSALKNSKEAVDSAFYKLRKFFDKTLSLYARNQGTVHWLDFDIDADKDLINSHLPEISKYLQTKVGLTNFVLIDTSGGMHVMVKRESIKFNPQEICDGLAAVLSDGKTKKAFDFAKEYGGEIIRNENNMIPLPGTLAKNYQVRVINKTDFD